MRADRSRTTDANELLTRLTEWVVDHDSDDYVPAWAAIRLGSLDAVYELANQGLIEPARFGWTITASADYA